MAIQRTTQPGVEQVTLSQAKVHLKEDLLETDNDAYISSLSTSGWTLTLDAFPDCIAQPMPNALAVLLVAYIAAAGAATGNFEPLNVSRKLKNRLPDSCRG